MGIEKYQDPVFKHEVATVQAECRKAGINFMGPWGKVVLKTQAPVLEKYSLPPTAEGVDLMKHAVARRISEEGGERLEVLANDARRILGIQPMPDRSSSCEVALARMVDATAEKLDCLGDGLGNQCRQLLAKFVSNHVMPVSTAKYIEGLLDGGDAHVLSLMAFVTMGKLGPSVGMIKEIEAPLQVPTLEAPVPADFFDNYVMCNRPAVLQHVFEERTFAPLHTFSDFALLRRLCGHRRVLVKSLAHNDCTGRSVFVTDPELKLPFAAFLDHVEAHERDNCKGVPFYLGKVPLRAELPELAREIDNAESCPQRVYGSCFGNLNQEGVFTYFGCGRNTTAVHFDMRENLLICICGTKRLWLYPPHDALHLYPVFTPSMSDFSRSAAPPFKSFDELSQDLQAKYPLLNKSHPVEVMLRPGDMLYLPSCWWHCVEGSEDRNMILNWWFDWHPEKKLSCFQ